jgi:hypothetical protein
MAVVPSAMLNNSLSTPPPHLYPPSRPRLLPWYLAHITVLYSEHASVVPLSHFLSMHHPFLSLLLYQYSYH